MVINLKNINLVDLLKGDKRIVLYGDFHVLNYLYDNHIILNDDITIYPDSTAVYFILKYFYGYTLPKLVSTDLQEELLNKAAAMMKSVFLLGDTDEVLNKIRLKMQNSLIEVAGTLNGYHFNESYALEMINSSNADILLVGLGVRQQEIWIRNNYKKLNVHLIISVGGWFQYLGGTKKRAPMYLRKSHLEWLYKMCSEFRTVWKRYFIVFPLFLIRIITGKIIIELKQ